MAILGRIGDRLTREEDHEVLWIEAWGPDALRVRATKGPAMPDEDWALIPRPARARIEIADGRALISNGAIRAEISPLGEAHLLRRARAADRRGVPAQPQGRSV